MLLKGKKALIMGVANNRSIAYGISSAFAREGARLAFSYAGDAIKKRVEPICEELGGEFTFPCDVSSDAEIAAAAEKVKEKWGKIDVLVHSVAYAPKEELAGRYLDTSRDGFRVALDISAYSLVGLCRASFCFWTLCESSSVGGELPNGKRGTPLLFPGVAGAF